MGSDFSSQQCPLHQAFRGTDLRLQLGAETGRDWALQYMELVCLQSDRGEHSPGLARVVDK